MYTYYASYEPKFISEDYETKFELKFQTVKRNISFNKQDWRAICHWKAGATVTNELTRSAITHTLT